MNRRTSYRIHIDLKTTLCVQNGPTAWAECVVAIANLSRGGMFVRCGRRLPPDTTRVLVCINSVTCGFCAAKGASVRLGDEGFGVRFYRVNAAMTELLGERRDAAEFVRDVPDAQVWID